MGLNVVEVNLTTDGSRGNVLLESDLDSLPMQIEELGSSKAREFAIGAAVKEGIKGQPGISRTSEYPYPINSKGETIENLKDKNGEPLPPQSPRMQPVNYRIRYEVTARQ